MTESENEKSLLPDTKNAPKRTGKRLPRPIDPLEDFDKPVTKQTPMNAEGSLLVKQPESPSVVNDRMKMFYAKPNYSKYKDTIVISLQMSVPLTKEHLNLIPKQIADGFHDINKKGRSRINFKDLPNQAVEFFLDAESKRPALKLGATKLAGANLAIVERKGEGTARKVIRWAFQIQAEHSDALETFSGLNLENDFWITMEDSQKELWDKEEGN